MKTLNRDVKRRDELLEPFYVHSAMGGSQRFAELDVFTLKTLVNEDFADPEDAQNSAPALGDILKFMEANPGFTCHGYAIEPYRSDYRISVEGVDYQGNPTIEQIVAFVKLFRFADELVIEEDELYCWFD